MCSFNRSRSRRGGQAGRSVVRIIQGLSCISRCIAVIQSALLASVIPQEVVVVMGAAVHEQCAADGPALVLKRPQSAKLAYRPMTGPPV